MKCHSKKKTITIKCWVDGNEDWSVVTFVDPIGADRNYKVVPTWIIRPANGDPEKIDSLIDKYAKTFPKYAQYPFSVLTKEYFKHYKDAIPWEFDPEKESNEHISEVVRLIKAKKYKRILIDSTTGDGFCYDEKKRKVPRRIAIDDIGIHGLFKYCNKKRLTDFYSRRLRGFSLEMNRIK